MSLSVPQTDVSKTDSPNIQSNQSSHSSSMNHSLSYESSQDHAHFTKNTLSSSSSTTAAVPTPSSPVNSKSPIQSSPSVSMSQPTTPRPTSASSPTASPLSECTPTQPKSSASSSSSSPSQSSQQVTPLFMPPVLQRPATAAVYPLVANNGDNNGKRKRRDFEFTNNTPTFTTGKYNRNIYAMDRSTILDVAVLAQVDRGFFLSGNNWTCYRRNYFQISAAFALQGVPVLYDGQQLPCLALDDQQSLQQIEQFYVDISARLSDCDRSINLVQHTAKRDKGPQTTPEPKPVRPGGNLSFSSVGTNQSIATFGRIQFKSATANNGKRRAQQQYYVVVVNLLAKIQSSDKMVPVASTISQPLIVRGRSPGHYAEFASSSTTKEPEIRYHHPPMVLTSTSPMIPGHYHQPNAPPLPLPFPPPPPPGMYAPPPGYSAHPYPPHIPPSSHIMNEMHYGYSPIVPGTGPSANGHPPTTSTPSQSQIVPPRPPPFGYSYHPHYPLPPPMHRSESAPSTYEHSAKDKPAQQQHHMSHFRVASTPNHPYHSAAPLTTTTVTTPTTTTASSSADHAGASPSFTVSMSPYSQPPLKSHYYALPAPLPPHYDECTQSPPPTAQADQGNWKHWHPPSHMVQQPERDVKGKQKIKTKPIKLEDSTDTGHQ